MPATVERLRSIKDISGKERFTKVTPLPDQQFGEMLRPAFSDVEFFLGTTAVHGLEPQQIAANVGLAMNDMLETKSAERKPIILPYVPGHPIYDTRNVRVLKEVYGGKRDQEIYLSADLGKILIQTEYGLDGYQLHWENVRRHQGTVQEQLDQLLSGEFTAVRLDGEEERVFNTINSRTGERPKVIELNTGANASAATRDGRVVAYSVFPNTLDGLARLVGTHQNRFGYPEDLVTDILAIGEELTQKFDLVVLPDIHPLGNEDWFASEFGEAIMTPPLKDPMEPPEVFIDGSTVTVLVDEPDGTIRSEINSKYDSEKGIVYVNVSGGGMGVEEVKAFVLSAQNKGYVISAPIWLKNEWMKDENVGKREQFKEVLAVGPELLFAKNEVTGESLCVAQMIRAGLGAVSNSQIAGKDGEGIPIILLRGDRSDSPETRSNEEVILKEGLGVSFNEDSETDIVAEAKALDKTIRRRFYDKVYTNYGVPRSIGGLAYTGQVLVSAYMEKSLQATDSVR